MNDLISIVVPIYNVEKFLDRCIKSIINQTYENIEIILVNDGSLDGCLNIMKKYAQKDNRIKCYLKENGGLSDARNFGINHSKGKYICFVDSDDFISENYIEKLYYSLVDNNVQISQCGVNIMDLNERIIKKEGYNYSIIIDKYQYLLDSYYEHSLDNIVVWNKLYLSSLFNNIKFPKGKIHEDEFVTYKLIYSIPKVSVVNENLYNYVRHENSITGKKYSLKRLDAVKAIKEQINFYKENKEFKLYKCAVNKYFEVILVNIIKLIQEKYDVEIIRNLEEEIKKNKCKLLNYKNKIKLIIFKLNKNCLYKLLISKQENER